ncbi:precorrin-2 C(20)-methyltransferase [Actinophytocola xanthii]|uniref:ATP-binding protein n=1 Tax=Actinophytocola xanthii TaxID=1912961 RepID=A0A1Q8CY86_9PSEU|nr:precorrin-2 C(20)-methyltransferase [Actinophytocola xanthii]OLF19309.1 ATP-binding protein [Actinophytocola xanthii]
MTPPAAGRLYGVGLGPGDPELVTVKAARIIERADVIAYHQGPRRRSNARRIADPYVRAGVIEELLEYPVTTGITDHPGGYAGAMAQFYERCATTLGAHLERGRDVVVLAEGDPLFYGSYMYVHDRLGERYETEVVPGVPAFAAATAALGTPLARQADVLTVLQGTLPRPELARRLADTDAAVIMKLGRTFPEVRAALAEAGRLSDAWYVERAAMDDQRWLPVSEVDPADVPYFSLIVVPGDTHAGRRRYDDPRPAPSAGSTAGAEVVVVGLGPGAEEWLTPEAARVLGEVDHVVGYAPYVDRVPQRPGLRRHASGNTVELDRARFALDLAAEGERVAVVSGGDAGVFGMASAVFEAAEDPAYADVHVRVVPGVSAVQAAAARAGAPIGADFAVLSLSDRLKPWSVIERRVQATARSDLVLAVYNPRSRTRTTQVDELRRILLAHRPADTVVVVARDIGRPGESLTVTTLADLDPESVDMRCLLIIGATSTRVSSAGRVWTPRYVEG